MMKFILYYLLFCCSAFYASGQQGIYSLANMPEAIKTKASVIVNLEEIDVKVESFEKVTLTVHKVFTVLNEDGKDALLFRQYSSKIVSLEGAEIKVYDANGKLKEKYKKKDMTTTAVGEGLIEDGYMTYYRVTSATFPITVELNYETRIKSTLLIPDYRFIHTDEGVVQSSYTIRIPSGIGLRYKAFNTSLQPVVSDEGMYKLYKWAVKDLPPIEYEAGTLSAASNYPYISLVADNFSFYGHQGDLSSWKSFGSWINKLYKDLDILPASRQQFFSQMVNDASTETEKIRRVYDYMQKNFRYVSIQLGLGGLKPFSAEFTDQKKYGDCKALSNFMKAALNSIGIKSHVAIINSNYNELPVDPAFPSNGFNHVILCVPGDGDSIWLECTSSTVDFGELGTFTENKNALLITDQGGVLVPTPKSNAAANTFSTYTTVNMLDDQSAATETIFSVKGEFKEMMNYILKEKEDDQKDFLLSYLGFRQPDNFQLVKDDQSNDTKSNLKMFLARLPEFNAGSKAFISPRINKMWASQLPKSDNRKFDYYFRFPFKKSDTSVIKLAKGMRPDVLLKENELTCAYASYKSKSWFNDAENAIYSVATLSLKQHKIAAADYESVKKFFEGVVQAETQKIVIKKE